MNDSCYVINVVTTDPCLDLFLSSLKYEIQQRRLMELNKGSFWWLKWYRQQSPQRRGLDSKEVSPWRR